MLGSDEIQKDICRLMRLRLIEIHEDSGDSGRLLGTHETQRDYWELMNLIETTANSLRLMRIMETQEDSCDSGSLLGTHETQVD